MNIKEIRKELDEWLEKAHAKNATGIEASSVFASIFSENAKNSPEFALQLGMAILMDKPIVIIAEKNTQIPVGLLKAARAIERVDFNVPGDMARIAKTIRDMATAGIPNEPTT